MTQRPALGPCPFCGAKDDNIELVAECFVESDMDLTPAFYRVECNDCGASIRKEDLDHVVSLWNRTKPETSNDHA